MLGCGRTARSRCLQPRSHRPLTIECRGSETGWGHAWHVCMHQLHSQTHLLPRFRSLQAHGGAYQSRPRAAHSDSLVDELSSVRVTLLVALLVAVPEVIRSCRRALRGGTVAVSGFAGALQAAQLCLQGRKVALVCARAWSLHWCAPYDRWIAPGAIAIVNS